MNVAKIIYEYLADKIPGIEVFIGYGSEFDKSEKELILKRTNRKARRSEFAGLMAPVGAIKELTWKPKEDEYDCLILCDDVREAFLHGLASFPDCSTGRIEKYISNSESESLTSETNVIYMTYVYIEPLKRYIKIGFCDYLSTLNSMITFDSLYIPFRLSKKNYVVKSTPLFDDGLKAFRHFFDNVIGFLNPDLVEPLSSFNERVYGISYKGDIRNGVAEAPDKIKKLLENHGDFVNETYGRSTMYKRELHEYPNGEKSCLIHKEIPTDWFDYLPECFQKVVREAGLVGCDLSRDKDRESLAVAFNEYIASRTKIESRVQPRRGFHSTGFVNTFSYGLRKIKKANGK